MIYKRITTITALILALLCFVQMGDSAQAQSATPFRVYMTFEDGPTEAYTTEILDLLAQYNAKATFFPNGYQLTGREAIMNRIVREGHAIGNHLWEEPGYYSGAPEEQVRAAYQRTEDAVRAMLEPETLAIYDAQPKIYRQPGGGARPLVIDGMNIITYNWNVQSDDCGWALDPDSPLSFDEQVLENVLNIPRSINEQYNVYDHGDGAVIVFHDINRVTGRVLPVILEELSRAGATFEALPRPWDQPNTMPLALAEAPQPMPGLAGITMTGELRDYGFMRAAPNSGAEIVVISIPPETPITVNGRTDERYPLWFRVEYEGVTGWMYRSHLRVLGPIPNLPIEG